MKSTPARLAVGRSGLECRISACGSFSSIYHMGTLSLGENGLAHVPTSGPEELEKGLGVYCGCGIKGL